MRMIAISDGDRFLNGLFVIHCKWIIASFVRLVKQIFVFPPYIQIIVITIPVLRKQSLGQKILVHIINFLELSIEAEPIVNCCD